MRIMLTLIGLLTVLAGVLPLLSDMGTIPPFVLSTEPGFQFLIIALGIVGLIYALFNRLLFGIEKFASITLALLTILGGMLPFLQNYTTIALPTSGPLYLIIIISIGIVGFGYSFVALG